MDEDNAVYAYNGLSFSLREENPATCDNMDKPVGPFAEEISQTQNRYTKYHLYDESKVVKLREAGWNGGC